MASIRGWWRVVALVVVACAALAASPAPALAARFSITGTVYSSNEANETMVIVTSDIIGSPQPITVDMSRFSRIFRSVAIGSPISLVVEDRPFDTFKAVDLIQVAGNYVNQTNFGTQESFNQRDDSIEAHVGNVPEDDEALAQQHRDHNLRRKDD